MLRRIFRRPRRAARSRLRSIKKQVGTVDPEAVAKTVGGPMEEEGRPARVQPERTEEREEGEVDREKFDSFIRTYSGRTRTEMVTAYPVYEAIRLLSSMDGRRIRKTLHDVAAMRLPLLLASHNAVGPTTNLTEGLPPESNEYVVASPYYRQSLRPLYPDSLRVAKLEEGNIVKRRWKRLPEVCSWGVEAAIVQELWESSPVVVLTTDSVSSLYGVYLSSMLDAPVMDVSYLWLYTKGKPLWRDERGRKRALHWCQAEVLRSLKPDYIVILGSIKRRKFKRVRRAIRSEVRSSTLVPIIARDHRSLGEKLLKSIESEVPLAGEPVHKVFQPDPRVSRLIKERTLVPLPVSAYNEVKSLRFRPLTLEIEIE